MLDSEGVHSCPSVLVTKAKLKVNKYLKADPNLLVTEFEYIESPIQAINTLKLNIQGIVKGSGCLRFKVVVSGETNFREQIATIRKYKGNREGSVKPKNWQLLRDWLISKPYTIVSYDEEADDVISRAILAGHVGCTIDKDLDNTPGDHYNFNKGVKYNVTEEQATRNFYTQMLTGDTADNIPGIRGLGPKKAEAILKDFTTIEEMEQAVFRCYEKTYPNALAAMTEIGQLLHMRRKENEMWFPITIS